MRRLCSHPNRSSLPADRDFGEDSHDLRGGQEDPAAGAGEQEPEAAAAGVGQEEAGGQAAGNGGRDLPQVGEGMCECRNGGKRDQGIGNLGIWGGGRS